ncbi:glycosyltransferase family 2 protein [Nocardioides nematodiphilus]|uniref:glycosyltransferase family 2 protein n=1 Tax=Nocardioides nematodiphilus TaxID=2849669 RepID=UPI001CDA26D4|nr:glycosyltransferase family 2 protein [Nocardioides nematodiphilus]MCA1984232.1 glycosyltransferase family 2 protein [Nocardioides nematodiphilus]
MARRRFPISLTMIVRDEARVLARCLESVKGLVDEIVVVDTGSSDDTVAIAESYGATVHHFTWIDDFSAARNHALAHATHPWRLVLDADEWIVDRDAAKTLFDELGQSVPTFLGTVDLLESREDGTLNEAAATSRLARLLPREASWRGRVHEQPHPELNALRLGLRIGHDGYLAANKERKEGRNTALLVASIEEDPQNPYLWFQLGNEFYARDRPDDALPHLVQAYNLLHPSEGPAPEQRPWAHGLTLRLVLTLTRLGRHEEASGLCDIEADAWPDSPDFHYVRGCAVRALAHSLGASDVQRAERLAVQSLEHWVKATGLQDRQEYAGVLTQRATVLAARKAAADFELLGDAEQAARFRALAAA